MKIMTLALVALSVLAIAASPVSATALDTDVRMQCGGTPTTVPKVDGLYQLGCSLVEFACDFVFDPCILD